MEISFRDFGLFMNMISAAFDIQLTREKLTLYYAYLRDISQENLRKGVDKIICERKYSSFPAIAEIREAASGLGETGLEDRARIAWAAANRALISASEPDDPVVSLAIKLAFGGWQGFGDTDPDNEPADRKHFIACYKVAAKEIHEPKLLAGKLREELEATRKRIAELGIGSEIKQIGGAGSE